MKKLSKKQIAIIAITVALLVVVATVILTVDGVYTGGFKHEFRHFYVSANGNNYLQDSEVVMGNVKFDVHYVLKDNVGYTVQVVPTGEDFAFLVDDTWVSYLELEDLTPAFDIQLDKNSFVIRCREMTMQYVLQRMYPNSDVSLVPKDVDATARYKLVITAGDGSQSISLTFRCFCRVKDVEIDPPSLLI